jgi:hypothetical protein
MPNTADKVTITPAAGKIVFHAMIDSELTEVGSIDAESVGDNGDAPDQIVIDKARLTNSSMNGGSF